MHMMLTTDPKKTPLPALRRLTWSEARRRLKPYVGDEIFIGRLLEIVEQFQAELGVGGIDVERLRTAPARIQALEYERWVTANRLADLDGTLIVERSELWKEMLNVYARAKPVTRWNLELLDHLEPFINFMKTGKRKKPTKPAP